MKDLSSLMKQAQAMQEKLGQAQAELEQLMLLGQAGDGLVKVTLKGTGQILRVDIDDSLMAPGEGEMVGDLVAAAHADAKRQLDARQAELMQKAAGPLAGMPGMPKF
ncbi:MAG TPA: YbaB/EbfC family nucleoid-associated protein [Phenylobacterium sp.]|jgi:DNA-binding YbaB/EbfC family protein|nr:YbaB/EbfC family nucleoid-associated protein [Phenylobacterium sp.]